MLRVVIVGYGEMFTNLIAATLDAGCEIVGVFRGEMKKFNSAQRKFKDIFNPSIEYNYLKSYNLHEIDARSVNSDKFRKELLKLNPDIVFVGSWGEKISKQTYDIPKIATINVHPSLLPKYRGPNPYFWTIKNMEQTTGVTFHLVDDGFDTGAILAQEEIKIYPSDTGETLKQRTVLTARGVACELLKDLSEDIIIPLIQREEYSSYYSHPRGLMIDFKKSSQEIDALIRAAYPWVKPYFYHNLTPLVPNCKKNIIEDNITEFVNSGTITNVDYRQKSISVLCGDNKIIKMSNISLYNSVDSIFTPNYIKREIEVGQVLE